MDFNKKANKEFFNNTLLFKTVGIVFLIIIVVLIIADFKIYRKKQELTAQINSYQKQIADIKKSSQTLKDEITNANNTDYLEKLGYEQLNQTRPGETEYMFVKSPKKIEAPSNSENFFNPESWLGWLSQSWNWLKSKF